MRLVHSPPHFAGGSGRPLFPVSFGQHDGNHHDDWRFPDSAEHRLDPVWLLFQPAVTLTDLDKKLWRIAKASNSP